MVIIKAGQITLHTRFAFRALMAISINIFRLIRGVRLRPPFFAGARGEALAPPVVAFQGGEALPAFHGKGGRRQPHPSLAKVAVGESVGHRANTSEAVS